MAHYAILDENNFVINVIVGVDETETIDGFDPETHYGNVLDKRCVRTSYNTIGNKHRDGKVPFRKNYAQIGYKYDEVGFFDPVKPFESWTFNTDTYLYDPPIPMPATMGGKINTWNPETLSWDKIDLPYVQSGWEWDEDNQKWKLIPRILEDGTVVSPYDVDPNIPE